MDPETPDQKPAPEPANIRFLRRLVTVLTATMVGGLFIIIALLVIRFSSETLSVPDEITLPDGTTPVAVTYGRGWYGVVSTDNQLLIYGLDGTLRQTVEIKTTP